MDMRADQFARRRRITIVRPPCRLVAIGVCLALMLAGERVAMGCSVPVFRYALEHWIPDAYHAAVLHRGPLSPDDRQRLEQLRPRDVDGQPLVNLKVEAVDLDGELPDKFRRQSEALAGAGLPMLILGRPGATGVVWSGGLTDDAVRRVVDSPLRQTIVQQLLEGESVVWVLLESGNAERDDAAWDELTTELQRLQKTLRLPTLDPQDAASLAASEESLKLSFTAHRLPRDAEAEAVLREMLLSVEPDLRDPSFRDEPMAFPIFGRGRVLYALIGAGINAETIEEACRFLTAGCQCTVKQQNPGVDLLLAAAWARYVVPTEPREKTLPPLSGLAGFGEADGEMAGAPLAAAAPTAAEGELPAAGASDSPHVSDAAAGAPASAPTPTAAPSVLSGIVGVLLTMTGIVVVVTMFWLVRRSG